MDIFSTPIFGIKLNNSNDINSKLESFVYNYKKNNKGKNISNRGGYHTNLINNEAIFYEFFEIAKPAILNTLKPIKVKDISVIGAWININGKYAYNTEHCHPECDLAAVYYIKTPKDSGKIYMNNPIPQALMNQKLRKTKLNVYSQHLFFDISEGSLFIFPGWLFHGVESNNSDEDRISMAFNINIENFYNNI